MNSKKNLGGYRKDVRERAEKKSNLIIKNSSNKGVIIALIIAILMAGVILIGQKYQPEVKKITGTIQFEASRLITTCPKMEGYKATSNGFICTYTTSTTSKESFEQSLIAPLDKNGCEKVNPNAKSDGNGGYRVKDMPGHVTIPTCVMPIEIVANYNQIDTYYVNGNGNAVTKVRHNGKEFLIYCRGKKTGYPVSNDRYDAINACGGNRKFTEAENNNEPLRIHCKGPKIGQPDKSWKVVENFSKTRNGEPSDGYSHSYRNNNSIVCEYGGSEYENPIFGEDNIAKTSCTGIEQLAAMDEECFPESDYAKIQRKLNVCRQKYGKINIRSSSVSSGNATMVIAASEPLQGPTLF